MIASTDFTGSLPSPSLPPECPAGHSVAQREAARDADLVRRVKTGDADAFTEIVELYRQRIFALVHSFLRNRADAEEITQDTFVRAHRGLANFRGDSSFRTWLHRIALNLSRNRYWHGHRRCQHTTRSLDCPMSDDNPATIASLIASSAPCPVQEAVRREFTELVAACTEQLGPGHRDILKQRNQQNLSYEEIAAALGISIGTVKSRIARARQNLRVQLAKACPEFPPDSSPSDWFDPARSAGHLEVICA